MWESVLDDYPSGEGEFERFVLDLKGAVQVPAGFYWVRVGSADPGLWGAGSEYQLEIYCAQGLNGVAAAVAIDLSNPSSSKPPQGTVVVWDRTNSFAFGAQNSLSVNLTEGVHTVLVTTAAGYLPAEDSLRAGQVGNPDSEYGNPRRIVLARGATLFPSFRFTPSVRVQGTVLDRMTGEKVAGAELMFLASDGRWSGLTFTGYPNWANYKIVWRTGSNGAFLTNIWLPTSAYGLTVSCAGYTNLIRSSALASMSVGTVTNMGTLLLSPVDFNSNGVADAWERRYGLTNCTALSDADRDLYSDRSEYLAGTDPTNRLSVFLRSSR
jgi:hypothetical protein